MSGERGGGKLRSFGRLAHHREVDEVVVQAADQLVAVAHSQRDLHGAVARAELREQRGKEVVTGADDADVEHPAFDAAQRGELLACGVQLREHRGRRTQQRRACLRQMQPPPDAVKERLPGLALELRDLDRDRGRREVQLRRRARERKMRCGGREHLELAQRGVSHGGPTPRDI